MTSPLQPSPLGPSASRAKSGVVTAFGIVPLALGGLQVLGNIEFLVAVARIVLQGGDPRRGVRGGWGGGPDFYDSVARKAQAAAEASEYGGPDFYVTVARSFAALIVGATFIIAGVGVLKRRRWGHRLTLILAGLAGELAVVNAFRLFGGVADWQQVLVLAGSAFRLETVLFLILGGYCTSVCVVFLRQKFAVEFPSPHVFLAGTALVQSSQDDQPRPILQFAIVPPILPAAVWLALAGSFYFFDPPFADFPVGLPKLAKIALSLSDWYLYLLPFVLLPVLAVDWLVFTSLERPMEGVPRWWLDRLVDRLGFAWMGPQANRWRQKRRWTCVIVALPVGVAVFVFLAFLVRVQSLR